MLGIDDIDAGVQTSFAVQRVSVEDQRGPVSDTVFVDGSSGGGQSANNNTSSYQPPARPFEPTGLDAFIYGSTAIELVWDRVNTSLISGYEIRRDGQFVGYTNGTSYFEELAVTDKTYRYDVNPVNREDPSMGYGFSSISVGLGAGVCL